MAETTTQQEQLQLPPGPAFGLWQVAAWNRDPIGFFRRRFARYGDPFTTPFLLEAPVVVTAEPDGVAEIFGAPPETFEVFGARLFEPVVGHRSLLVLDGDRHKKERKLLAPAFHGERMKSYGDVIIASTLERIAPLRAGAPFSAQELTRSIALDVILRVVFGVLESDRRELMRAALVDFIERANPAMLMMRWLRTDLGPWSPGGRFARARRAVDALVYEEIRRRREQPARDDILGMMLAARYDDGSAMSDDELRDELLTMVMAGHETTASALAWALHHCHHEPAVLAKLRSEVQADSSASGPYVEAVCQETLRIHPVVVDVVRRLRVPFRLRGHTLPAGVAVCAATLMTHHDERIFAEPERFRPERFLEKRFTPFELYPFGGGNRRCIGAAFAMFEMKLVLATIVRELDLAPVRNASVPRMQQRNVAWGPSGGVPMLVEARR